MSGQTAFEKAMDAEAVEYMRVRFVKGRAWTQREVRALNGEPMAPMCFTGRRAVRARKRYNQARRAMLRYTRSWWPGLWLHYGVPGHARAYVTQTYGRKRGRPSLAGDADE